MSVSTESFYKKHLTNLAEWKKLGEANIFPPESRLELINGEIIEIRMEIIDEFQFNPDNFSLKQYFTLNFINPDDWKIDFQDFHIGIKHITEPNKKFITRLRGIGQKNNSLIVRLENMFIEKEHIKIQNNDDFEVEIDEIHRIIEEKFTQIFKPDLLEHSGGEI